MTRRSKRELHRAVEDIDAGVPGPTVTFGDYYDYYQRSVAEGHVGAGPTAQEFFGRDLTEEECVEFWKRLIRVWDGEERPPQ